LSPRLEQRQASFPDGPAAAIVHPMHARDPELGPIRPPSEASSLLVRVTRNCPWNRCAFCPVYKGTRFSLRDADEVCADIREMATIADRMRARDAGAPGMLAVAREDGRAVALQVARFLAAGASTAFLQDANSLIMPVADLERVLRCLKESFPTVDRVTTYARSHTITKRTVEELTRLRTAGLTRVHVGLESGSDRVLALVDKGATSERHVTAGLRIKAAGLSLSEYVMPGLGGAKLSEEHARETARVLRAIDPDFVRLRTLAVPGGSPLADLVARGEIDPMDDLQIARELQLLLEGMTGMTSEVRSDHVLNLLEEVEGSLPTDLPRMLAAVDQFLALDSDAREVFVVGRRLGLLRKLDELQDPTASARARAVTAELRQRWPGPIEGAVAELMARFV